MSYKRPAIEIPPASDYALRIKHKYKRGWSQRYLLLSDAHWDSPECYINLLRRHMEEAKATNALILDNGDFFDVIGGANDQRGTKSSVIEEANSSTYLDNLVELGIEEFKHVADNWVRVGRGNHDEKVIQRKETDIIRRWADGINRLKSPGVEPIHVAGYTGWIKFLFEHETRLCRESFTMKLEHGTGGNSPVTKGTIEANRRQVRTQANFYVSGHIHESWQMPYIVEVLNLKTSRIEQRLCQHIQLASYKMDFRNDGAGSWAMQRLGSPKPIGGAWLDFFCEDGENIGWRISSAVSAADYPRLQDYLRPKARIKRDYPAA